MRRWEENRIENRKFEIKLNYQNYGFPTLEFLFFIRSHCRSLLTRTTARDSGKWTIVDAIANGSRRTSCLFIFARRVWVCALRSAGRQWPVAQLQRIINGRRIIWKFSRAKIAFTDYFWECMTAAQRRPCGAVCAINTRHSAIYVLYQTGVRVNGTEWTWLFLSISFYWFSGVHSVVTAPRTSTIYCFAKRKSHFCTLLPREFACRRREIIPVLPDNEHFILIVWRRAVCRYFIHFFGSLYGWPCDGITRHLHTEFPFRRSRSRSSRQF